MPRFLSIYTKNCVHVFCVFHNAFVNTDKNNVKYSYIQHKNDAFSHKRLREKALLFVFL